ncbi:MAG: c-type cytochrome [Ferruginibacter sp.]
MQDKKGYGRIYRITPKGKTLHTPVIDLTSVEGQVEALKNPAINVRGLGFNELTKQGEAVIEPVRSLLNNENPYIKARAIWLLPRLGQNGILATAELLKDSDEITRATAFRSLRATVPVILPYAVSMQHDPSPIVRREIIIALRDIPFSSAKPVLLELIKKYDGTDRWYLEAIGATVAGHEAEMYPEIKMALALNKTPLQWDQQMSTLAWRLHPPDALDDLLLRATDSMLTPKERRAAITAIGFIHNKKAAAAMFTLSKHTTTEVRTQAAYWLSFRQGNDWHALLNWKNISFNTAFERKLAVMKAIMKGVTDEHISLDARKGRLEKMANDSIGGQLLIGLASEDRFPAALVPFMEKSIFNNPDITVRVQAGKYFKQPGGKKNYSIPGIASLAADAKMGKTVFTTYCASCHKIGQEGTNVGPELGMIGKKFDQTALLDAIINPSAGVMAAYEPWLINTKDGGSFFGFMVSNNKRAIIIKDVTGKTHSIALANIRSRQKQTKSLMPEPGLRGMTEQELADVVKYLQSDHRSN